MRHVKHDWRAIKRENEAVRIEGRILVEKFRLLETKKEEENSDAKDT